MSGAVLSLLGAAGGGSSSVTITLSTQNIEIYDAGPVSATYQLNSNGSANESINGGAYNLLEYWCVPGAEAVNYECYATLVSGALAGSSAATGTWLALSTSRIWRVSQIGSPGVASATVNIGIRRVGTGTILASADISLYAEYY